MAFVKKITRAILTPAIIKDHMTKVFQYITLRENIKDMTSRKEKIAAELKEFAAKFGSDDGKGGQTLSVGDYQVTNVAKTSMSLDRDRTLAYLKEHGLTSAVKRVVSYEIVEDEFERLVREDIIPLEDVDELTNRSTSFSIDVREKVSGEVQESTVKSAASEKVKKPFGRK